MIVRRAATHVPGGSARPGEGGFSLPELLVVVFVTSVLAGVAVPVFLAQRGKAADAATQQDLVEVAKAVIAAFARDPAAPQVRVVGGRYEVDGEEVGPVSNGVAVTGADPAVVDVTGWTQAAWCLSLTHTAGHVRSYKYSAQGGLQRGSCTSPVLP